MRRVTPVLAVGAFLALVAASVASAISIPLQEIDIKPFSYPNSINLKSNGLVSVAILSSAIFDATRVDPATVELRDHDSHASGAARPVRSAIEDVYGDGLPDLVLKFKKQDLPFTTDTTAADLVVVVGGHELILGTDTVRIAPGSDKGNKN